jgi:hypothetical protein
VTFQTGGKKLSDFSMVIEDQIVRDPRVTTFDHLGAGDYTITATPPAGLVVSQIVCNVSPGSSADVSAPPTVTIHLAKKGSARCTFVMAATT